MRHSCKAIGTLAAATSLALCGSAISFADDVVNTLAVDSTSGNETVHLSTVGATQDVGIWIRSTGPTGSGDSESSGCDVSETTPLVLKVVSKAPGIASVAPVTSYDRDNASHLRFTACGVHNAQDVRVTALATSTESALIDTEVVSHGADTNPPNTRFDTNPSKFTVDGPNPPADGGGGDADADADGDGVADSTDNCVNAANAGQADADADALGDACDGNSYAPAVHGDAADTLVVEGDTLTTSGSFSDQDGIESLALTADNGTNGAFDDLGNGSWTWTRTTDDDVAQGTITVTASDSEHADAADAFLFSAANADPVITGVTQSGQSACGVTLAATWTDAGGADTHTSSVVWNDGSTDLVRSFAAAGTYSALVTVTDDDGGADSEDVTGVRAYNRPSVIGAPINTTGTRSSFKIGSTIPVKLTVLGCDGGQVSTLTPAVHLVQNDTTADVAVNEAVVTESATNGKVMRWSDPQYIYNLSTKNSQFHNNTALTQGTYTVSVSDPTFQAPVKAAFDVKK